MDVQIIRILFSFILLLSMGSFAKDTGDHLIDGQVLSGYGNDYTEDANKIVEGVIVDGISEFYNSTPGKRSKRAKKAWQRDCVNAEFHQGYTVATFAVIGGLEALYRWVIGLDNWRYLVDFNGKSTMFYAIEHNLLYMAQLLWKTGYPKSYLWHEYSVHDTYQVAATEFVFTYMMKKRWPLRGFEAAWNAKERFTGDKWLDEVRGTGLRDDVVRYLRKKETNPENNARLQTFLNKLASREYEGFFSFQRLASDFSSECGYFDALMNYLEKAIQDEVIDEKVVSSFNIHGRSLLQYFTFFGFTPVVEQLLKQDYASKFIWYRDPEGRDLLLTAIEASNKNLVVGTLDQESSLLYQLIPAKSGYKHSGDSPLHFAVRKVTGAEVVKVLLERSSHSLLNQRNADGLTPAALLEQLRDSGQVDTESYKKMKEALQQ